MRAQNRPSISNLSHFSELQLLAISGMMDSCIKINPNLTCHVRTATCCEKYWVFINDSLTSKTRIWSHWYTWTSAFSSSTNVAAVRLPTSAPSCIYLSTFPKNNMDSMLWFIIQIVAPAKPSNISSKIYCLFAWCHCYVFGGDECKKKKYTRFHLNRVRTCWEAPLDSLSFYEYSKNTPSSSPTACHEMFVLKHESD